jgi:hypothetical protein
LISIQEAKSALTALSGRDKFERMLHTAAILTDLLMERGIKPIIVGGLSVEIYTMNGYTTQDLDFVMSGYEQAADLLSELGFERVGKDWVHPAIGVSLEIPSSVLAGDYAKVTEFAVGERKVYVIGIEDILLDRLRSAVHWKSGEDREWGYRLLQLYKDQLDVDYLQMQLQGQVEKEEFQTWMKQKNSEPFT